VASRTVYEVTTAYRGASASVRAFNSRAAAEKYHAGQVEKWTRQRVGEGRILAVQAVRAVKIGRD
jgi:hypothetical protein